MPPAPVWTVAAAAEFRYTLWHMQAEAPQVEQLGTCAHR